MVYYKGAVSYETFQEMPYDLIFELKDNACKINDEIERNSKK